MFTRDLAEAAREDYLEGFGGGQNERMAYFGTTTSHRYNHLPADQVLRCFYSVFEENQKILISEFVGCVLSTDREDRVVRDQAAGLKPGWNYLKNKEFFAGIIDARRSVTLVTDIEVYHVGHFPYVVDELLWLADNGYQFFLDLDLHLHRIIAIPGPAHPALGQGVIENYKNGSNKKDADLSKAVMVQKLEVIKAHIVQLREARRAIAVPGSVFKPS